MKWKFSKYNYQILNKEQDLLLFNTYVGSHSYLKLQGKQIEDLQKCKINIKNIETLSEHMFGELNDNGYIIPIDQDEDVKLRKLYLDEIGNNQLMLTIMPTMQCNFRCKYCYESFHDGMMNDEIQKSLIQFVSRNIEKYSSLEISWFGGESLLALPVIEALSEKMIEICKKHRKPFRACITTNAYLLDANIFRRLLKCRVLFYQITIDGLESIHDKQRVLKNGEPTFSRIISNLLSIKEQIPSKLFKIIIRTNVSLEMLERLSEYKKYFSDRFGTDSRFQFYLWPVTDLGGENAEQFSYQMINKNNMSYIYDRLAENHSASLPITFLNNLKPGSGVCYAAKKNEFVINEKGDIFKCTLDFSDKSKIGKLCEGKMNLDYYQSSKWLCDMNFCKNTDCFFAPICLKNHCPYQRLHLGQVTCPLVKENLGSILKLLDTQDNTIFRRLPNDL